MDHQKRHSSELHIMQEEMVAQSIAMSDTKKSSSPLDLPEILYTLVQFLDRESIFRASLVCQDWSRIFIPLLFREVRFDDWAYPGFAELFQKNIKQVVMLEWRKSSTYAELRVHEWGIMIMDRSLEQEMGQPNQMNQDVDQEKSSKSIKSREQYPFPILPSACLHDLVSILSPANTHRLRVLVIHEELELRKLLLAILPKIPTLTCLRIENSRSWQKISFKEILNLSGPSLLSLDCDSSVTLSCNNSPQEQDQGAQGNINNGNLSNGSISHNSQDVTFIPFKPQQVESSRSLQQPRVLRVLRLNNTSISPQDLINLVQDCPQLEEFYVHQESGALPGVSHRAYSPANTTNNTNMESNLNMTATSYHHLNWSTEFAKDLSKACPNLIRLYLSLGSKQILSEHVILKILEAFPRLQSLGVPYSCFGEEAIKEILRTKTALPITAGSGKQMTVPTITSGLLPMQSQKYSALTSLDIYNLKGSKPSSKLLQAFLEQSTTLLHFCGDGHMICIDDMIVTNYDESQSSILRPWGCLKVETFVIGFQFHENADYRSHGKDYSHLEKFIYQQLSRLTSLRKLRLLKDGPSCRLMRDEEGGGLRSLSKLNLLQSFRVSNRNSAAKSVSREDQQDIMRWMAQTWPCLRRLRLPWNSRTLGRKQIQQLLPNNPDTVTSTGHTTIIGVL